MIFGRPGYQPRGRQRQTIEDTLLKTGWYAPPAHIGRGVETFRFALRSSVGSISFSYAIFSPAESRAILHMSCRRGMLTAPALSPLRRHALTRRPAPAIFAPQLAGNTFKSARRASGDAKVSATRIAADDLFFFVYDAISRGCNGDIRLRENAVTPRSPMVNASAHTRQILSITRFPPCRRIPVPAAWLRP